MIGAAISPTGDLLLAQTGTRIDREYLVANFRRTLSKGDERAHYDTSPDFSPDGQFVDLRRLPAAEHHDLRHGDRRCRVLRRDEMLPSLAAVLSGRIEDRVRQATAAVRSAWSFSVSDGQGMAGGQHALAVSAGVVVADAMSGRSKDRPAATLGWKRRSTPVCEPGVECKSTGQPERRERRTRVLAQGRRRRRRRFSAKCGWRRRRRRRFCACLRSRLSGLAAFSSGCRDGMQNPFGACGVTWICGAFAFAMLDPGESRRYDKQSRECNPLEHWFPLWFRGLRFQTDASHLAAHQSKSTGATSAPWGKHLISTASRC